MLNLHHSKVICYMVIILYILCTNLHKCYQHDHSSIISAHISTILYKVLFMPLICLSRLYFCNYRHIFIGLMRIMLISITKTLIYTINNVPNIIKFYQVFITQSSKCLITFESMMLSLMLYTHLDIV